MGYRIGIFTKYREEKDRYSCIHNSPCKIFKILDELSSLMDIKYCVNNYSKAYDLAIFDRISKDRPISAGKILNYSEFNPVVDWATHYASTSIYVKSNHENFFSMLNYCQGVKLKARNLTKERSGATFVGRVTPEIERKIKILSKNIYTDIYPIKYWRGDRILRFHNNNLDSQRNLDFLQTVFKKAAVKRPLRHAKLYKNMNLSGYNIGFVPSVYPIESGKVQVESSSKFFEYIGCGIPVLIEETVPEAELVKKFPFLGRIYRGQKGLISEVKKMQNKSWDFVKILEYANRNHFPDSRARALYENVIIKEEG